MSFYYEQPSVPSEPDTSMESDEGNEVDDSSASVNRSKRRRKIKGESAKGRSGQRLDAFQSDEVFTPDTKTPKDIDDIDVDGIETQKDSDVAISLLGVVLATAFAKIFEADIKPEEIRDFDDFKKVYSDIKRSPKYAKLRADFSDSEINALNKVNEIIRKPSTKLHGDLDKNWKRLVDNGKKNHAAALGTIKGTATKSLDWIKENPGKSILFAVGAFALVYAITSGDKKKSVTNRVFSKKTALVLGVVTVGALLGSGKIKEWLTSNVTGKAKQMALKAYDDAKESSMKWLDEKLQFSKYKDKLNKLPAFKNSKLGKLLNDTEFEDVADDMDINTQNSDSWKDYKGEGGVALLLYKWTSKKNKLDEVSKKLLRRLMGEDNRKKVDEEEREMALEPVAASIAGGATEKQQNYESNADDTIRVKYGVEYVRLEDKMGGYKATLNAKFLAPLRIWARENKAILGAGALAIGTAIGPKKILSFAADVTKGSARKLKNTFVFLAKGVQGAGKGVQKFPLSSLFIVSALLYSNPIDYFGEGVDKVKSSVKNMWVPKDPPNFKKHIKNLLAKSRETLDEAEVENLTDEQIEIAYEIINNPDEKLREFGLFAENAAEVVVDQVVDVVASSPQEIVRERNLEAIIRYLLSRK